jgi:hypothetical protein
MNLKKTLFLVGSSALLFSACGDDGGGSDAVDAAVVIDAGTPDPDADTRYKGTVSVAELVASNPEGVAAGVSGAGVVVSFTEQDNIIAPHPDFPNNIGECQIKIIDANAEQNTDGGDVAITGTNVGDFTCSYQATPDSYECSLDDAGASGTMLMADTVLDGGNGQVNATITLTIPNADFSGATYTGQHIRLEGFATAEANGVFPIVAQPAATTLVLANVNLVGVGNHSLTADSPYKTLVGEKPAPGGLDFLGAGAVTLAKAEATDAPAIATSIIPLGDGFTLADDSVDAHEIPASGDVKFSCDDAQNGDCGDGEGTLQGIVVFGETTDTTLPTGPTATFSDMPDPTTQYARFQCSGIGMKSITMPAAALALIMGTTPTRIQTTVTYTNGELDGNNTYVMANGRVGFTTAPFAAP